MLDTIRYLAARTSLGAADLLVTAPLRWTWAGLAEKSFSARLLDFRPSDPDTVADMMAGRYVLAAKLVDTHGASPFAVDVDHADWVANLHGFSWLRHFREVRDPGQKSFARTLVLDWIGHEGRFERDSWALSLTAQRVLNWLRNLDILLDGAGAEHTKTIQRSLSMQVQSLRIRARLATDPVERLLAVIALAGATLCEDDAEDDALQSRLARLNALLAESIDGDGLHLTRSPRVQLQLLVELSSLRQGLGGLRSEAGLELAAQVERMHESLDALTLGSGEPVYFNGAGQLPHDTLIAVQSHGAGRRRRGGVLGGYGILRDGAAVVIADSGKVPPLAFAGEAHASALAFEFSHGTELIVGSCGPAPADLSDSRDLFRQGIAHSTITIDDESASPIIARGPLAGRLQSGAGKAEIEIRPADHLLVLASAGYSKRFGVTLERRLTLLSEGTTLVGQDRLIAPDADAAKGRASIRFHLAPGTMVRRVGDGVIRLILSSGAVWTFLWEGAQLREDSSVRHSASRGFDKTRQLVLERDVEANAEVAWIFTREQS